MSFLEDWVSDAADVVSDVADWGGDAISVVADPFLDVADTFLTAIDDVGFFDVVEYGTIGLLDIEYGEHGLGVDFGIEDVFGYGVRIGDGGFSYDADFAGAGFEMSWNDAGFQAGGTYGIEWGPLPYVEGHAGVQSDGDLAVGGQAEGYLPTPTGTMVGGEVEGDYEETDEGFRSDGSLTSRVYAASGTHVGAGVHGSYEETDDGYEANVGVHGEVGQLGGPTIRGSVDYSESRHGDVRTSGVSASGEVEGAGFEVGGSVGYQHVETSQGSFDVVTGEAHAEVGGQEIEAGAQVVTGPGGTEVSGYIEGDPGVPGTDDVLDMVGDATGVELPPELADLPTDVPLPEDQSEQLGDALGDALASVTDELGGAPGTPLPPDESG